MQRELIRDLAGVLLLLSAMLAACSEPQVGAERGKHPNPPVADGGSSDGQAALDAGDAAPAPATCADAPCDEQASCDDSTGERACTCHAGYAGDGSTCEDVDECASAALNECDAHATCTNTPGGYECACDAGYVGSGRTCVDVDECAELTFACRPEASCVNAAGSASWQCNAGFLASGDACADVDECASTTLDCGDNASCGNSVGSSYCECDAGFHDADPDDAVLTCVANVACPNEDECDENNATCSDTQVCSCNAGYRGDGATCTDIDECAENRDDCDPAADCTDTPGGFTCSCKPGFTGDGRSCAYVEECGSDADCGDGAKCLDALCGKTCTCPAGYESNGAGGCVNTAECTDPALNDCHQDAACTDEDPGYSCACKPGFIGDGYANCTDVDECKNSQLNECGATETCTNLPGSYTCGCNAPYVKDGNACYCDLGGMWGMRQDVMTSWEAVTLPGGYVVVAAGSYRTTVWELHRLSYDGSTLGVRKKGCGSAGTPDLISPPSAYGETYSSYVPDAVWNAFAMVDGADVAIAQAKPGTQFTSPREAAVLGITLADPLDNSWPQSRADVSMGNRTDPDGDGVPGLMLWSRTPAQMTQTSTTDSPTYYSFVPVDAFGNKRAACVSNASRAIGYLQGEVESCSRITGNVVNERADGRVYDCRIAPANLQNCTPESCCSKSNWDALTPCTSGEINILDGQAAAQTTTATFELVKLSGDPDAADITCQTVRQMLPAL